MQVDSCGFPKGRDEGCPEESACRNGPAAILSVSTGCDPGEGPSSEMGTALGRQGPNNSRARVAGPPRKKPRGRSPVPQFDAQACPNTNRCPPAFGMAERRESLRGKAWHSAQPTSGNAENEPHTSLDGSLLVRPVFARADCGAATDGQPIRQRYRTISEAISRRQLQARPHFTDHISRLNASETCRFVDAPGAVVPGYLRIGAKRSRSHNLARNHATRLDANRCRARFHPL